MSAELKTRSEMGLGPVMNRAWAMPCSDTLDAPPILGLVKRYLRNSRLSVDCFARNCGLATITNDLNPKTSAEFHMDVKEFLEMLLTRGDRPDVLIFDPPFSPTQMQRAYESIGLKMNQTDALRAANWKAERNIAAGILEDGGVAITCGWHSNGFGMSRGFELLEVLLVAHGGGHNDTIVTVERRIANKQQSLFNAL